MNVGEKMSDYVLELKDVSKSFPGVKALSGVSIRLEKGKVCALIGENGAGKSTLIKCMLGLYHMDEGQLYMEGKPVTFRTVVDARNHGLSVVQQELSPIPMRSVMENVWLEREPMRGPFVNHKQMYKDTKELLERYGFDIDPKELMGNLSVAQQQMVEIIKAVSCNAKVVMMDEATSSLTPKEIENLFGIIRRLQEEGTAVIYITHKMEEVFAIAHMVTVLRDGEMIATHMVKETSAEELIHEMVGRNVDEDYSEMEDRRREIKDKIVLKVENLSAGNVFRNINLELHEGEILGISGLVGAGRTELLETIFGLRKSTGGQIYINGQPVCIKHPIDAVQNGLAFLVEDRRRDGILPDSDIVDNTMLVSYDKYLNRVKLLNKKKMSEDTRKAIELLKVKTYGCSQLIKNLSGGNQQKVLINRWLSVNPQIFLLDEPTRGIDIGAKSEIHSIILNLAAEGKSVLAVSSEIEELLRICDRIMVLHEGLCTGILERSEMNQDNIMSLACKDVKGVEN